MGCTPFAKFQDSDSGRSKWSTSHFFVQVLCPEYFTVCVLHSDVKKTSKFRIKWRLHEEVSEPHLALQFVHRAMCYIGVHLPINSADYLLKPMENLGEI